MKKLFVLLVVFVLSFTFYGCSLASQGLSNQDFLRIHIRANSNLEVDQNVKYAVKTAIVNYLTPFLAGAQTKQQALAIVKSQLDNINKVADNVLISNGFTYTCSATVCQEVFPTRYYDGVVLASGLYDALIINLGSGKGDNWWCVVYPPLCFVPSQNDTDGVVFKWKILEIINNWKNNR